MSTSVDLQDVSCRLSTQGVVYSPNKEKCIECYVDSYFTIGWDQVDSNNVENGMSRLGYVITYTGCPLLCCSKLQTEITLSTIEA